VRAGSIIPTQQIVQYTDEAPINPLFLDIYPATLRSQVTYYEDDGRSFQYSTGGYFRRLITQWVSSKFVTLDLHEAEGAYSPPPRTLVARFIDVTAEPKSVKVNGEPVRQVRGDVIEAISEGWVYSKERSQVHVKTPDRRSRISIRLER
jgi:alpha-glucosidase